MQVATLPTPTTHGSIPNGLFYNYDDSSLGYGCTDVFLDPGSEWISAVYVAWGTCTCGANAYSSQGWNLAV